MTTKLFQQFLFPSWEKIINFPLIQMENLRNDCKWKAFGNRKRLFFMIIIITRNFHYPENALSHSFFCSGNHRRKLQQFYSHLNDINFLLHFQSQLRKIFDFFLLMFNKTMVVNTMSMMMDMNWLTTTKFTLNFVKAKFCNHFRFWFIFA